MSAWCQCHHRSSFVANWTGTAGTGWSSLLWSLGFQIPCGINFNALLKPWRDRNRREAEFSNFLRQSLHVSIGPPVRPCNTCLTITASLGCLGFACFHEVPEGFLHKVFLDAHGFPSQALCKGHEQQRCHKSCLSLPYCFNLQRLKDGSNSQNAAWLFHAKKAWLFSIFSNFLLIKHCIKKVNPT